MLGVVESFWRRATNIVLMCVHSCTCTGTSLSLKALAWHSLVDAKDLTESSGVRRISENGWSPIDTQGKFLWTSMDFREREIGLVFGLRYGHPKGWGRFCQVQGTKPFRQGLKTREKKALQCLDIQTSVRWQQGIQREFGQKRFRLIIRSSGMIPLSIRGLPAWALQESLSS